MKRIYVAGPVLRTTFFPRLGDAKKVYDQIRSALEPAGLEVQLPISDPGLEIADPKTFFKVMADRISDADLVISVLPEINPSSGIESTMAAFMQKPQYIVTRSERQIPRLLLGLPKVKGLCTTTEVRQILSAILEVEHGGPALATVDA